MKKQEIQKIVNDQRDWLYKSHSVSKKFRIKVLKRLYNAIIKFRPEIHLALARDIGHRNEEFCFDETDAVLYLIKDTVLKLNLNPFVLKPQGVCLIMTPWFSPFLTTMTAFVNEIARGNTVVIKPSSHAKNTSEIIDELVSSAFPEFFAKVVLGSRNVNKSLTNIKFDKINFCGNKEVAKGIVAKAIDLNIPFEIDGCDVNTYIVKSGNNLKKEAYYVADTKFSACGQTKDALDIVVVEDSVVEDFTNNLIMATEAFIDSDPLVSTDYGKIKDAESYKRLIKLIEKSKDSVVYGGAKCEKTNQIGPVLIKKEFDDIKDLQEKILGPVLYIVALSKFEIDEFERDQYVG